MKVRRNSCYSVEVARHYVDNNSSLRSLVSVVNLNHSTATRMTSALMRLSVTKLGSLKRV